MSDTLIFDRELLKLKKQRSLETFKNSDFLHTYAANLISERLADITRSFENSLYIGNPIPTSHIDKIKQEGSIEHLLHMNLINTHNHRPFLIGDEELLPFGQEKLDLIIANMDLHQTNDLPGALIQMRRALKPDGLFIAAMFGGETLWQLRDSLNYAEQKVKGGISPRVHPFADKQQMGALLQRAGYALPVVDSEILTVTYPNIFKLIVDLRDMGETNITKNRPRTFTGKEFFHTAGKYYHDHYHDKDNKLEATFEIIFLIGWAPADNQQKPLRPGSAKTRLADALNTDEIGTGDKTTS